ncbi:MAG: heme lyase CcmF/NrfE family subunit [Dehalococcoidia bacterium]|nr:MAG: heme lyase CcmF/NrfE family subunit [Dehalococcoidia bacterium]
MNIVATVGASALLTALGASLFAAGASIAGLRLGHRALLLAGRRAILAVALLTTTAVFTMGYALLTNDFSIAHVASVSSSEMQTAMKWASLYSGQPGSLLFWTWSMSLFMAAFVLITVPRIPWGAPHAVTTLGVVIAAFLFALVFFASPFRVSAVIPADGQGLNPLLVDPGMLVHPPFLLSGLVSTVLPFTLGAAALLSGRLDGAWVRHARGWALTSFLVLSVGNFLGGWWAYTVLGWGGYWGWDPVENSAILPLLPIIGFLHALIVQERRGMLKAWNVVLVLTAFCLAVFGTFNVRSGLVASVHSFAQSEVGPYFLVLLGATVAVSLLLIVWRLPRLRAVSELDSLASRETGLILNSYLMVAMALVILGGTLFPVFSELLQNVRITVGPPFFNEVMGPLFVVMLLLAALGTILPWRRAAPGILRRRLLIPSAIAGIAMGALFLLGMRHAEALAATGGAIAVMLVTLREFAAGARAVGRACGVSPVQAAPSLFARDPRRYGGYLVHLGVAVMVVAVVGSTIYREQARAVLAPGESFEARGYTFTYERLTSREPRVNGIELEVYADVRVTKDGSEVALMRPGRRFFSNFPEQPTGIVALDESLTRDLYLFVQGWNADGVAEIHAFVNPLIMWLWIGGGIYIAGGLLAYGPARVRRPVVAVAPAEAQQA